MLFFLLWTYEVASSVHCYCCCVILLLLLLMLLRTSLPPLSLLVAEEIELWPTPSSWLQVGLEVKYGFWTKWVLVSTYCIARPTAIFQIILSYGELYSIWVFRGITTIYKTHCGNRTIQNLKVNWTEICNHSYAIHLTYKSVYSTLYTPHPHHGKEDATMTLNPRSKTQISLRRSENQETEMSMSIWPASLSAVELPQYISCCWDRGAKQRRFCEPSELQDRVSSATHCPADWCGWWWWGCWANLCCCSWAYWLEDWSCITINDIRLMFKTVLIAILLKNYTGKSTNH